MGPLKWDYRAHSDGHSSGSRARIPPPNFANNSFVNAAEASNFLSLFYDERVHALVQAAGDDTFLHMKRAPTSRRGCCRRSNTLRFWPAGPGGAASRRRGGPRPLPLVQPTARPPEGAAPGYNLPNSETKGNTWCGQGEKRPGLET